MHLALQKKIMDILTVMFPNLQFIVTTHSPCILSAAKNTVIYVSYKRSMIFQEVLSFYSEGLLGFYADFIYEKWDIPSRIDEDFFSQARHPYSLRGTF